MKKFLISTATIATCLLAGTLSLTSCGDDDPTTPEVPSDPEQPTTPDTPDEATAMSPAEQQKRMEDIAKEVMGMMPSNDFKSYADLAHYVETNYSEDNYDWDDVSDWARTCWDAARTATGNTYTERDDSYYSSGKYVYKEYKALILASNFTGHFKANGGKWTHTKASDLQFTFRGNTGDDCTLKIETSGNVTKVYVANWDEWTDYESSYEDNTYKWTDYYDRTQCTVGVPENIVVTLTQGGRQLVKTTVNIKLSGLSGENFDISKGNLNVAANVELSNGYTFSTSEVKYAGNSKLTVAQASMKKNGTAILTMAMSGDISGLPSCNVEAFSKDNFDLDDYNTSNANAKNAYVKIDVLGKIQLQGIVSDVRKYCDLIDQSDEYELEGSKFQSCIDQANKLSDVNVFYDNTTTKQASVYLEPFAKDEGWQDSKYWEFEPVMKFYDGSSISPFSSFFNDNDFRSVIRMYERLVEDYGDLFE